ncbi:hypothetical protein GCM10010497_58530 [Streptomyces cinereoruber]|uniref:Uncharacterized protein n=1 Tax=Streptomyces cinereoruber TaxID=67260 RepID=A0AAV4KTU5_9ACTN|nr:hypothetical protein [Streptomyces cinereoruber]MBB4161796.1 putative membrane protein YecN with MAPEG domain [Streptomyces cinereoruber]NIH65481.1 putative membrane protein YecN with MAPEG domain [Streptomyces cinereoruber]QEV30819.1 hypothetical protein CP977_00110 [Streptomyces cinereoruber]GGR47467.1 hypothetical protein GCM10010497_58530 [Streptomyces cinereoruber]
MTALLTLFGVIFGIGALSYVVVRRRGRSRTETAEGLLQEQQARLQAHQDRVSYNSWAVHNYLPTASDSYGRRNGQH